MQGEWRSMEPYPPDFYTSWGRIILGGCHLGDFWWTAARFGKMGPWTGCYNSYHGPVTVQLKPPFTKFNSRLVIREYFFIAFNKNPSTAVYHWSCHRITFKSYSVCCRCPAIRKQQRKVNLIDPELLVGKQKEKRICLYRQQLRGRVTDRTVCCVTAGYIYVSVVMHLLVNFMRNILFRLDVHMGDG